jgi:hypothetical protein
MLHSSMRVLAFGFGLFIFLGGLVAVTAGWPSAISGIWAIVIGSVAMVASVMQRTRYRSQAAERNQSDPGPGGGEDGYIEPRFVPTTEVFADPATGLVMRVFADPRTGERLYRAEGPRAR